MNVTKNVSTKLSGGLNADGNFVRKEEGSILGHN